MKLYQRLCLIMAHEGISGLIHRLSVKGKENEADPKVVEEYHQSAKEFYERALKMEHGDLKNYFWYHTIDLGNGLITPGAFDYRRSLDSFKFSDNMEGMNILDVGSATGFFAFEFEKRGANVISVEVPSMADWDRFPGETVQQMLKKFERALPHLSSLTPEQANHLFRTNTLEELHHLLLDGPFKFCHRVLKSRVQRCYSTIYDLSKEKVGRDGFDLVFLGDILVHTLYPLKALAAVASLCRGTLIISQHLPKTLEFQPAMFYLAGDKLGEDAATWWLPNTSCFEQILKKLGFNEVVVGSYSGFLRPVGIPYERAVIHATK